MSDPIDLVSAAHYYRGLSHQVSAFKYLQGEVSLEVLNKFAEIWRKPVIKEFISLNDLYAITINATKEQLSKFVEPLNAGFERFSVDTPLRIAHFLAQVLHESGEFKWLEELASGDDYEGRSDLGNYKSGDGRKYKGRGLIQVTGRGNYDRISKDLDKDYIGHPEKLSQLPDCVLSAFWYWDKHSLNSYADRDDLEGVTRIINGGYNGFDERQKYLKRAKDALGVK